MAMMGPHCNGSAFKKEMPELVSLQGRELILLGSSQGTPLGAAFLLVWPIVFVGGVAEPEIKSRPLEYGKPL
jgi:hypothetical protein